MSVRALLSENLVSQFENALVASSGSAKTLRSFFGIRILVRSPLRSQGFCFGRAPSPRSAIPAARSAMAAEGPAAPAIGQLWHLAAGPRPTQDMPKCLARGSRCVVHALARCSRSCSFTCDACMPQDFTKFTSYLSPSFLQTAMGNTQMQVMDMTIASVLQCNCRNPSEQTWKVLVGWVIWATCDPARLPGAHELFSTLCDFKHRFGPPWGPKSTPEPCKPPRSPQAPNP